MIDYPVKLSPYLKSVIWGGNRLHTDYGKKNIENLGESWEFSVYPEKESIILNGEYEGRRLSELLSDNYPVLIKFLDSALPLSIQVHPSKNEMWYILDSTEDSFIVYGLNGNYSADDIAKSINEGTLEKMLNYIHPVKGETYYIPSGLVHALGPGLTVAEIQQTSDITYRLYDYNRTDKDGKKRQLHIKEGLGCIKNYNTNDIYQFRFSSGEKSGCIVNNNIFSVKCLNNSNEFVFNNDTVVLITDGYGKLNGFDITKGECIFCPSGMHYSINSNNIEYIITEVKM